MNQTEEEKQKKIRKEDLKKNLEKINNEVAEEVPFEEKEKVIKFIEDLL